MLFYYFQTFRKQYEYNSAQECIMYYYTMVLEYILYKQNMNLKYI